MSVTKRRSVCHNAAMDYSHDQLKDFLEWDIDTWKHALWYWDEVLDKQPFSCEKALELGARNGGLSLYLAEKGMQVVCSDLNGPTPQARELIEQHGQELADRVSFESVDATAIPCAENSFDLVVFKSVLGGIGMACGFEGIQQAVREIHRVLRPGGLLLFAENLEGSRLHRQARRAFVPWGKSWLYPTMEQIEDLLTIFDHSELRSYGFFSCFKKDFAPFVFVDRLVCRSRKSRSHYMVFGYARK